MEFMESMENQFVDFSTCKQAVKFFKIYVKSPCHKTLEYVSSKYFVISFRGSFDTFQIFQIFHVKVLGKLGLKQFLKCKTKPVG